MIEAISSFESSDQWERVPVEDIATVVGGSTPSTNDPMNFGGDIGWLTPKDLSGYLYRYISRGERNITNQGLAQIGSRLLPAGTVLLTSRAPVGYLAIASEPLTTNQGFKSLIPKEGYDSLFLFYLLSANIDYLKQHASGTTFVELSGSVLRKLTFLIPPLPEQRRIAQVLGTLDDKIELNRQMNHTLEEIARTLFKAWFVDFAPVRAKAEGRDTGLPAEIAALFPSALADSELGDIPAGWQMTNIGEVVDIVGGSTPSTANDSYWQGGEYRFATPKDMSGHSSPVLLDTERKVTRSGVETISSGLLPARTLLMSSRAPVGYLAIAEVPVCVNQGIIAMRGDGIYPCEYLLNWCYFSMDKIEANASGTTFAEISKRNFRPIPFVEPSPEIVKVYSDTAVPAYERITNNERENRTLAELRDTLLPRLLSGELRVGAAEEMAGSVV